MRACGGRREERREEEMGPAAPQRENAYAPGSFVLRVLYLLRAGIGGEFSGEGFSRIFISFPGVTLRGPGLL